jgi:hypothetical protein
LVVTAIVGCGRIDQLQVLASYGVMIAQRGLVSKAHVASALDGPFVVLLKHNRVGRIWICRREAWGNPDTPAADQATCSATMIAALAGSVRSRTAMSANNESAPCEEVKAAVRETASLHTPSWQT